MCGRYVQKRAPLDLLKDWSPRELYRPPRYEQLKLPIFNIAPTQPAMVVRADDITIMKWGLVPGWAKDEKIGNRMINARAETLAEKPAFRTAYKKRRCVVPTDGFYEWQKSDTPKGTKQPYYIHWAGDEPRVFAGLWESWNDPDGVELLTFTIITTAANEVMKPVHDRMPVILSRDEAEQWLDVDAKPDDVASLLRPCPEDWLALRSVSTLVNSPRNDQPECIEPIDP
jgi:putative SOS response-associated peptidase YedK